MRPIGELPFLFRLVRPSRDDRAPALSRARDEGGGLGWLVADRHERCALEAVADVGRAQRLGNGLRDSLDDRRGRPWRRHDREPLDMIESWNGLGHDRDAWQARKPLATGERDG